MGTAGRGKLNRMELELLPCEPDKPEGLAEGDGPWLLDGLLDDASCALGAKVYVLLLPKDKLGSTGGSSRTVSVSGSPVTSTILSTGCGPADDDVNPTAAKVFLYVRNTRKTLSRLSRPAPRRTPLGPQLCCRQLGAGLQVRRVRVV